MKWPLFENKIKETLSSHRSEVDMEALWSALEPQVDALNASKHKRRRGGWWFLLAATLLLGSGTGLYFFTKNKPGMANATTGGETTTIENGTTPTTASHSAKNVDLVPATSMENGTENTIVPFSPTAKTSTETKAVEVNRVEKTTTYRIEQPPMANQDHSPKPIDDLLENTKMLPETSDLVQTTAPPYLPQTTNSFSENKPLETTLAAPGYLPYFSLRPFATESTIPNFSRVVPAPTLPDDKRHPMDKRNFHFHLAANGGMSYAARKLSATTSTADGLLQLRARTEDQLETLHLGLRTGLRHRSGFDFSTGLQFTRIMERFEYRETTTTTETVLGIAYLFVNPNNDTIPVMGEVPYKTTTTIEKRYFNRYALLDIPLLAGYFMENNDWSFGAQAGVFANISLKTSGRVLINEKEDEDIQNLFRSKVGMSYYMGVYAGRKWSDQLEVGISPYIRYFPKDFATGGNPISQKYTLGGLDVRVKYRF